MVLVGGLRRHGSRRIGSETGFSSFRLASLTCMHTRILLRAWTKPKRSSAVRRRAKWFSNSHDVAAPKLAPNALLFGWSLAWPGHAVPSMRSGMTMEMDAPVEGFCGDATGAMYMTASRPSADRRPCAFYVERIHTRPAARVRRVPRCRRVRRRPGPRRVRGHAPRRASRAASRRRSATGSSWRSATF